MNKDDFILKLEFSLSRIVEISSPVAREKMERRRAVMSPPNEDDEELKKEWRKKTVKF